MSGVEEAEEASSRSEAFAGGEEPRGDGVWGELVVLCRDSVLVDVFEVWLESEFR